MLGGLSRALGICILIAAFPCRAVTEDEDQENTADFADSLAATAEGDNAKAVLKKTQVETTKMRHTVSRVLHKSVEEVKTLKSLLTTNAKGASALNDLFTEMSQLTKRIAQYEGGMEACTSLWRK